MTESTDICTYPLRTEAVDEFSTLTHCRQLGNSDPVCVSMNCKCKKDIIRQSSSSDGLTSNL